MNPFLGILFGLLSMIGYGVGNAISKTPIKKIGSIKSIFYLNAIISIFLFLILLATRQAHFEIRYILIAAMISFIAYIPLFFFYQALKLGKVGIITPIANSSVIFTIILSIIFFKESLSLMQVLAIILIILGIILISINLTDFAGSHLFQLSSGIPFALITSILWGLTFFLLKIPVGPLGPYLSSLILQFGITIFSGIHLLKTHDGFAIKERGVWPYLFAIAIADTVGILFFYLGISLYDVSIISALTFSSPWVAVLLGRIIYKEKLAINQYLAIALTIFGLVLIWL